MADGNADGDEESLDFIRVEVFIVGFDVCTNDGRYVESDVGIIDGSIVVVVLGFIVLSNDGLVDGINDGFVDRN